MIAGGSGDHRRPWPGHRLPCPPSSSMGDMLRGSSGPPLPKGPTRGRWVSRPLMTMARFGQAAAARSACLTPRRPSGVASTTRPNPQWSSSTPSENSRAQMPWPRQRVGSIRISTLTATPVRWWSPRGQRGPADRRSPARPTGQVLRHIGLEGLESRPDQPYGAVRMAAGPAPIDGVREAPQVAQTTHDACGRRPGPPTPGTAGVGRARRDRTGRLSRRPGSSTRRAGLRQSARTVGQYTDQTTAQGRPHRAEALLVEWNSPGRRAIDPGSGVSADQYRSGGHDHAGVGQQLTHGCPADHLDHVPGAVHSARVMREEVGARRRRTTSGLPLTQSQVHHESDVGHGLGVVHHGGPSRGATVGHGHSRKAWTRFVTLEQRGDGAGLAGDIAVRSGRYLPLWVDAGGGPSLGNGLDQ